MAVGARNVSACFVLWSHLDDGPFRVLVGMALQALDEPSNGRPARLWFAGRGALAEYVRGERKAATRARASRLALARLIKAGAVTVVVKGAPGRRAEYRLNLDAMPVDNSGDEVERESNVGDPLAHERGRPTRRNVGDSLAVDVGDSLAHPGTTRGTTEESRGGQPIVPAPPDRAREAATDTRKEPR